MIVEIRGINPPGRRCSPAPEHGPYEDIHVGIGRYTEPVGLVPGDTQDARWRVDVKVVDHDGRIDLRGSHVDGKRGDRHIYLNWMSRERNRELRLFRRGKVMLEGLDARLVEIAEKTGAVLSCTVNLTNERGHPTTKRFRAADLSWRLETTPGGPK